MPVPLTLRDLRADCARCVGLCCVALPFAASADFAVDKPAAVPCRHLQQDHGCGIHAQLRERGFPGCTVFDCFGAGQHVTQGTFAGRSWRDGPDVAGPMFLAFAVARQLHELLWYLTDVLERDATAPLHDGLRQAVDEVRALSDLPADELVRVDVAPHRLRVDELLTAASRLVRGAAGGRDRRRADLVGAGLAGADLHGADLRGALLLGADLRRADLRDADLLGTDLRGADLRGADLTGAVYLTQPQAAAARGDRTTRLPGRVARPAHWT
ncbi:pentapeptide repeat-containing protein [Cellulomonas sp. URHB0016]